MAINWTNTKLTGGTYGGSPIAQIAYQEGVYKFKDHVPLSSVIQGNVKMWSNSWDEDVNGFSYTPWESNKEHTVSNGKIDKEGIISGTIRLKSEHFSTVDISSEDINWGGLSLVCCSTEYDELGHRNIPPFDGQYDSDGEGLNAYYEQFDPQKEQHGIYPTFRGHIIGCFDKHGVLRYVDNPKSNTLKTYCARADNYIPKGFIALLAGGGIANAHHVNLIEGDTLYVDFSEADFIETSYADLPDDLKSDILHKIKEALKNGL